MRNFPTAHCHPQSLDSASTPEAFAEREIELGTGTITVTDHGTLVACRKVYDLAKSKKLTPILGLEAYFRDDNCPILTAAGVPKLYFDPKSTSKSEADKAILYPNGTFSSWTKYHHLTIHFLDQAAYETGVRLLSVADERAERHGSERKPIFNWQQLEELGAQNVTMTTGCLIGMVQRHLLDQDNIDIARKYYERLKALVKPGNFYVEVFPHKCDKNWVEGIFLTLEDGTKFKYYSGKTLRTNVGEITAAQLAHAFAKAKNEHTHLLGVKNYHTWEDLPGQAIVAVDDVADFMQNECRPWATDGDVQRGLNRVVMTLARQYGDKILIGDDSHFAHPDEKIVQDVRLAQNGAWRFFGSYHRQDSAEAYKHFKETLNVPEAQFESWVDNAYEWADRFKSFEFKSEVSLPTKFYEVKYCEHAWHQNPKIEPKDHSLLYTMELIKKHGRMDWSNAAYRERLKTEVNLLHENGTLDLLPYFFVVEEACSLYEDKGLLTGPGRGSAAGLLLAYLLGITHVDPLRYELSMDRFITLDRIRSGRLPDIDQDLPHRDLLIGAETSGFTVRFDDGTSVILPRSTRLETDRGVLSIEDALSVGAEVLSWT